MHHSEGLIRKDEEWTKKYQLLQDVAWQATLTAIWMQDIGPAGRGERGNKRYEKLLDALDALDNIKEILNENTMD